MYRPRPVAAAAVWLFACLPLAAQEVTLPLARYDELRALAEPEPEAEPEPPAPLAFEEAALSISVDGASATITQELKLALYGDAWRKARLGETGTFIDADFGSAEGRLTNGAIEVRGAGRHRLRLSSVVPVAFDEAATRPTWRLAFRVPAAALVHGRVEAPGIEQLEAEGAIVVAPQARRADTAQGGGGWSFVAAPGAEVALTLYGSAAVPERASLPLEFEVTSAVALEVAHGRRRADAWLEVRVRQGRMARIEAPVANGFEVIDVAGDAVAGWDVEDRRLVVTPLAAVTGRLRLEVEMAAGAAAEFDSPLLLVPGAAMTLAATRVHLRGDGLLQLLDAGAGRQPDSRQQVELPAAFRSAPGMALVLPGEGAAPRWQVSWPDQTEVLAAQVDRLLVDVLLGDGTAFYQLWTEVRNRGEQRLTLELPAGARLIEARRDGRRLMPGNAAGAWAVPLAATEARQVVFMSGLVPLNLPREGQLDVPLPVLSAPAAKVEIRVLLPGERRYALVDAGRRGAVGRPPAAPAPVDSGRLAWKVGGAAADLAFGGVELLERPPGFSAIEATWSALATAPAPLRLKIENDSDKRGWF